MQVIKQQQSVTKSHNIQKVASTGSASDQSSALSPGQHSWPPTPSPPNKCSLMIAPKEESRRRNPVLLSVTDFNSHKLPALLPNERRSQQSCIPSATPSKSKPTLQHVCEFIIVRKGHQHRAINPRGSLASR